MGVCLYLLLNPDEPAIRPRLKGKALLWALPALDRLATKLGVRPLQSFMDNRSPPPGVDWSTCPDVKTDPEAFGKWFAEVERATEAREIAEPWSDWFDPRDGVKVAIALAERLESGEPTEPELAVDVLAADLRDMARCLGQAAERGISFRLEAW